MLQGVLEKNICFFWGDSSVFSCTDTDSWILPESKSEKSSASIPIPIPIPTATPIKKILRDICL